MHPMAINMHPPLHHSPFSTQSRSINDPIQNLATTNPLSHTSLVLFRFWIYVDWLQSWFAPEMEKKNWTEPDLQALGAMWSPRYTMRVYVQSGFFDYWISWAHLHLGVSTSMATINFGFAQVFCGHAMMWESRGKFLTPYKGWTTT